MKITNTQVYNFEGAFRGMRNPLESWARSDSKFGMTKDPKDEIEFQVLISWREKELVDENCTVGQWNEYNEYRLSWLDNNGILRYNADEDIREYAFLGPNDIDLAQRLIKGGSEHRKFLRQITVSADVTAPIYLFKELDTYKVGTVANSTSTMHKLTSKPITLDCFETDDMSEVIIFDNDDDNLLTSNDMTEVFVTWLEGLRLKYVETKDKKYWKELVRWLPESWLQTRTMTFNYEILRNIVRQRTGHKLTEWKTFIDWIHTLPYAEELIFYGQ